MRTEPHGELKSAELESACDDLRTRTLARMSGDFARLIYLASTRDYNSGEYHHAGLQRQFGGDVVRQALAECHREVFRRLVLCSVAELVEQLDIYIRSTRLSVSEVVLFWERLQPYRVAVPHECSSLTARFFVSNVTAALEVLASR
jgi:hypothetical protein